MGKSGELPGNSRKLLGTSGLLLNSILGERSFGEVARELPGKSRDFPEAWGSLTATQRLAKLVSKKFFLHTIHHPSSLDLSLDHEVTEQKNAMLYTLTVGKQAKRVHTIGLERRLYTIEASDPARKEDFHGGGVHQRRRDDNENKIRTFEGGGGRMGAERRIVQNTVFFRGKRHDNKIVKVQILLSRNFVVIAQVPSVLLSSLCRRIAFNNIQLRQRSERRTSS